MMTLRECMQSAAVSTILALAIATAALAGSREEQRRLTPSDIAAMARSGTGAGTSGVPGIQTTVLSGDPTASFVYFDKAEGCPAASSATSSCTPRCDVLRIP